MDKQSYSEFEIHAVHINAKLDEIFDYMEKNDIKLQQVLKGDRSLISVVISDTTDNKYFSFLKRWNFICKPIKWSDFALQHKNCKELII
jgi:hypothetical protein